MAKKRYKLNEGEKIVFKTTNVKMVSGIHIVAY